MLVSLESLYFPLYNNTSFALILDSWNEQDLLIRGKVKSAKLPNALSLSVFICMEGGLCLMMLLWFLMKNYV